MRPGTLSLSSLKRPGGAAALLVVSAALLVACGDRPDPYQTQVVNSVPAPNTLTTITPIERGKIRREVERVVKDGMAAWLENDLGLMPRYFSEENVEQFKKQAATYGDEGRVRVRSHSEVRISVTEIASSGKQALVEYNFTDDSYFSDLGGKNLSEPKRRETVFQLTLEYTTGGWRIIRIIGRLDSLQ